MAHITLKVKLEDTALGPVMIQLRRTPGVVGWEIELDNMPPPAPPRVPGKTVPSLALELFVAGEPVTLDQIARHVGGHRNRAHGATNALQKQKLIHATKPRGTWELTAKGRAMLGQAPKLLPPPAKAKLNGHAKPSRGNGAGALVEMLKTQPLRPIDIKAKLSGYGVSPKGLSGLMFRAKRDGMIAKNADGTYRLTAKAEG